jgi:hypothetical protein
MMSRFWLQLSALLIVLFTSLGFMLSALGSTQPIHPALRGFAEGCEGIPQPCWYGIVPGMTTLEAVSILENLGYQLDTTYPGDARLDLTRYAIQSPCPIIFFLYYSQDFVRTLHVSWDQRCDIRTGDLILMWGMPSGVKGNPRWALFTLQNHEIMLETTGLSMMSDLLNLNFSAGGNLSGCVYPVWRGFAAGWYYRQLMPDYYTSPCGG